MTKQIKYEFELFICEAERLTSKSFYQQFVNNEIGFSAQKELDNSPCIEELESYVLHFRKFLQQNDRVNVHKINRYIHEYINTHKKKHFDLKQWARVYDTFNHLLNAPSLIGRLKIDMGISDYDCFSFSLLEIFKIRTYGDLSHLDKSKRETHLKLSCNSRIESLYGHEYYSFLFESGELIKELSTLLKSLV